MHKMNNIKIAIVVAILLLAVSLISRASDEYKPFVSKEYDPNDFKISQAEFRNGNVLIRIIEAKKISKNMMNPLTCVERGSMLRRQTKQFIKNTSMTLMQLASRMVYLFPRCNRLPLILLL